MLTYITIQPLTAYLAGIVTGFVVFGLCYLWECKS